MSFMKWMSGGSGNGNGPNGSAGPAAVGTSQGRSDWPDNDDRYYGLVNVGNTCYASSILQALYFCRTFRECVNNYPYPRQLPTLPNARGHHSMSHTQIPLLERQSQQQQQQQQQRRATASGDNTTLGNSYFVTPKEQGSNGNEKGHGLSFRDRAAGLRRKKDRSQSDATQLSGSQEAGNDAENAGGEQQERSVIDILTEDLSSAEKYKIDDSMFASLKDLFWSISTRIQRSGSISPQRLIGKLKECNELFRSNAHQDAHEFLNYLLNEIVENVDKIYRDKELNGCTGAPINAPNKFRGSTWVHTLFEGLLTNETKCLSCENVTSRDETLLDVSVDIHENTSVTNCLNQFAAGELLCHNNKFYCDNCGGLQEAERRMRLKRLPNILALHLKRFKYHEGLGRYVKLSYRVNFPTELRVPNTTEETEDLLYSLSAIVVHLGGGPYHGHYISIVHSGDKWILFDDDCVDIIDENELYNYFGNFPNFGSGYVLFYERTDFDPLQFDLPRAYEVARAARQQVEEEQVVPEPEKPPVIPEDLPGKFFAPARPPPLISTTRSFHGGINSDTMSPVAMSPNPMSPSAMRTPSASTTQMNSTIMQSAQVLGRVHTDSNLARFSQSVSPENSRTTSQGVAAPPTVTVENTSGQSSGKSSRSWFGLRSKK